MPNYTIQTLGCQMNYSDTERVETYLEALGYNKTEGFSGADLIIFNTCSIRQKAEDRIFGFMKAMHELKQSNPGLMVALTGCMVRKSSSKYSPERDTLFSRMRELDIALRIEELPKLAGLVREIDPESTIEAIEEENLEDYFKIQAAHNSYKSKKQAFVPVSTGCDKFCTYCIVPYSRGREKTRSIEDILEESRLLVENGCVEITLVGQTVNSYGLNNRDKKSGMFDFLGKKEPFVHLLEEMDKLYEKGLKRVRFTSPHPKDMSDQLIDVMASLKTQMPYLHLPVQSGDNRTLKRMNRTYTVERYREIVAKLREKIPGISISSDIIVGFCGETDEEYDCTYKFFEEMKFEHAYISQYSQRSGTFSARFMRDDIETKVKKERWFKLNELLKKLAQDGLDRFVGQTVEVLVETQEGEVCSGRSEHFKTVQFEAGRDLVGQLVNVKINKGENWVLFGELA